MRKTAILLFLASLLFGGVSAQTLTKEKAQSVAENFFKKGQRSHLGARSVRSNAAPSLKCSWDSRDIVAASNEAPTFYAFEETLGQGFVIVAGDGENARILGYSFDSNLPKASEMPDGLADMLAATDAQVKAVRSGAASVSVKSATPVGNVVVNLNTAPWGQRAPFNNLCFTSTGASAATGCVPTAYSILMFHHKWPVAAKSATVYHPGTGEAHQIGYEYDWDNMISNYSGTYSEAQAAAVATLMRDFGYANGVAYGTNETGGNESATTLVNYFKYKSETPRNTGAAEAYVTGRDIVADDTTWKQYIKESLDAGCPIPYSSSTTGGGRHVFICDGYTDADYYHFNWGWSGSGNGWFTLDNMTPDASSNYSNSHKAYFMLKPNRPTHVVSVEPSSYLMGTATINGSSVAVVEEGQKATLVATPNSTDYVFVKWTKGEELVSRSATTTVTITGADTYTAHFGEAVATADVEIAVAASTGGTATINGTDAVTIAVGEKITLVATPQSGYYFVNWTKDGEVVSTEATFSTTAQSYCTYTANFEAVATVKVRALGSGGYRYVGATGTATSMNVEKGSIAVVRTEPAGSDTKFAYWTKNNTYANDGVIVSNKTTYEFVATEKIDLYINYVSLDTDLNVSVAAVSSNVSGGTVTLNGSTGTQSLPLGSEITLSAEPEPGYRFLNWTKNVASASSLSVKSAGGEVVSTEPTFTTVLREGVTYTANFERLAVDPVTPPVVTLPEVTGDFIRGDGVLRFYRLALPITLSSYQSDFGSNATQVYAFWQEAETFLNKVYIPLGICFEVVEDARLIASSRNDIDNNPINAASYGTELTNGLIGEGSYDVGLWISLPADGDNSGVSALSGVYSKVAKGSGYAKADVTVVGHELGHLFGSQHVHDGGVATEPGFGSSIMGYGDQLPFFSVASLKAIRSEMVSKNHSFYADAARTQLVGSDGGNNYVYGVVPGTSSAPMITETGMKTSYRIPKGACFAMPIPATDANGDRLTYAFQQYEDGAVFHAYAPQESNVVDFRPSYILWADDDDLFTAKDGTDIPSMPAGTYNFAAVVNDLPAASNITLAAMQSNPFYSNYDAFQTQVTIVDGEPFTVSLSDNKASYAAGEKVTVSWRVNDSYFGTQRVNIRMSDDYGKTFKYTLAENVDVWARSCQVTMPNLNMTTVREQFGNYQANVRPGIIRVEVVGDIAYSLSLTDPASSYAEGGFLVTGGSGEGGGDEGEGEQTEDITTEKADLSTLLAEMKAYIATFATVEKYVMGGYTDYQVTFTADHGAVTTDMVAEAYRAMDAAEATLETATTKAELNTSIAALQTKLTDLQTNKALPGEGEGGEGEGGEGEDLTADKAALQALIADAEALIESCGQVVDKPATEEKIDLQVDEPTGAFYLFTNADQNVVGTKKDGDGIGALLDGNTSSYMHTQWDGTAVDDDHYVQVTLNSAKQLDAFTFTYATRAGASTNETSPAPTIIKVYTSADGSTFTDSGISFSSDASENPLPKYSDLGAYWTSSQIELNNPKAIRFYVTGSVGPGANNYGGHQFFAMSEFGLTAVNPGGYETTVNPDTEVTSELLLATYEEVIEARAALSSATTVAELTAAKEALDARYNELLEASKNSTTPPAVDDLAAAQEALQTLIEQTQALIDNCGTVEKKTVKEDNKLKLQVDNPTGAFYLSTNADHNAYCSSNKKDGNGIGELVDGDNIGFFHSQWESALEVNKVSELHFLQVDLGDGNEVDEFKFNYVTRNDNSGNPYPTNIVVYGSEDGKVFGETPLVTLESGLPIGGAGVSYESAAITCGNQYKSLRFTVAKSAGGGVTPIFSGKVYCFAMSEFGLTSIVTSYQNEATVYPGTAVTPNLLLATFEEVNEAAAVLSSATTADELTAAKAALQVQYEALLAASDSNVDKAALRTIIDQTQALVEACYDVKGDNKVFKYGGSLYITEADAQEAAAAVETAEATYNSATLTQTQCDAEVTRMQGVYDKLYYAVSHATLPVMVTTDWTNPYIYTIGINRSATSLLEWDANTSMVDVAGKYEFGNEAQAWCFFDATDGCVYIAPYQEFSSSSYRVLSSNDLKEGDSKVKDVVKGTDGYTQEWTIVYNADKNMYNIYCLNDNGDKFYFSNHGGDGKKMGFYNDVNDAGSLFRFSALDAKTLSYSDAYNKLYNFVENDVKVHGTVVGDDSRVGFYTEDMANAYNNAYNNANSALKDEADEATCEASYDALSAANSALHINMPMDGKVYRFRSAANHDYCNGAFVYADVNDNKLRWKKSDATAEAATLWSFTAVGTSGYTLQNLHTGTYMQNFVANNPSQLTESNSATASIVSLSGNGQVGIKINGTMMHAQKDYNAVVHWNTEAGGASAWLVEEVDLSEVQFPVSISKYGYAGLYLNYPVNISDGVEAYVVKKATGEEGVAILEKIESGIIPANTGVILKSQEAHDAQEAKDYVLNHAASNGVEPEVSLLEGANYKQYVKAEADIDYYLFGAKSGVVGLYKAYEEYNIGGTTGFTEITEPGGTLNGVYPIAGNTYYLCNKQTSGEDVVFSVVNGAIAFNKEKKIDDSYRWLCSKNDDGTYVFKNVATNQYFAWRGLSNNAYSWSLYDTVQDNYGDGLQAGCVSMKNGKYLVVKNGIDWDESTKDGYYRTQFSSSFYFEKYEAKSTSKTNDGGYFQCSANKIYLPYSAVDNASKFTFRFDGGTTTDLEEALFGNDAKEEIFDLQGRRVERITAPGLYIVNGQKRYVKAAKF